jgi:acetolactate synthase regulatory subunit
MTEMRPYSVAVALIARDSSTLLSLVSTLHRRGVDVLSAELTRPTAGRRAFTATFHASWRQARTVEASLRNLVDVVGVEMCEAADGMEGGHVERIVPIGSCVAAAGERRDLTITRRRAV